MTAMGLRLLVLSVVVLAPIAEAKIVKAKRAAGFYDSIGINTKFAFDGDLYSDGSYSSNTGDNFDKTVDLLKELKIAWARDFVFNRPDAEYLRVANARSGTQFLVISQMKTNGLLDPSKVASNVSEIQRIRGAVIGVEGPNEWDHFHPSSDNNWAKSVYDYQKKLFNVWNGRSNLKNKPVLCPSFVPRIGSSTAMQNQGSFHAISDNGNLHIYPGHPEDDIVRTTKNEANGLASGGVWCTEIGWRSPNIGYWINDNIKASYVLRAYAENYRLGMWRTAIYTLYDHENNGGFESGQRWGLVARNGQKRAAFHDLKRLINLVRDTGNVSTLKSLNYTIDGSGQSYRDMVLQHSDGRFFLLIWRPRKNWNFDTKKVINSSWHGFKVRINTAHKTLKEHVPNDNKVNNVTQQVGNTVGRTVSYGINDRLVVLEIIP